MVVGVDEPWPLVDSSDESDFGCLGDDDSDDEDLEWAFMSSEPPNKRPRLDDPDQTRGTSVGPMPPPTYGPPEGLAGKVWSSGHIPKTLISIMVILGGVVSTWPTTGGVEIFAGCQSITNGLTRYGIPTASVDFQTVNGWDDINTSQGFLRALGCIMRLGPWGFIWAAMPCSSWVWIGRYQTGRNRDKPLGDQSKEFVCRANQQVCRIVLLLLAGVLLHNAVLEASVILT